MDLLHLPWFRKIGEIFKRSILLFHFPIFSRIVQVLHVSFPSPLHYMTLMNVIRHVSLDGYLRSSQRYIYMLAMSSSELPIYARFQKMSPGPAAIPTEKVDEKATTFILPDLVSLCKFPVRYHPDGDEVDKESGEWLDNSCPGLNARQRNAVYGLQGGALAAYTYTTGPRDRLRVIADYINYLFHL